MAIVGGTVLAGPDLRALESATVVIEAGAIAAVGANVDPPAGAQVYEADGMTVLPGFIDAHVHIGFARPLDVLRRGVTTVRDLAWPPADIYPLATASRQPGFPGPLILCAGPMVTVPGGYPMRAGWAPRGTGIEVTDLGSARAAVREIASHNVAVIKVGLNAAAGPTLSPDLLGAIVEEAHVHGLRVTAHIFGLEELEKGLDAGLDEMAHMLMSPERIPDAVMDRMIAADMTIVPTLSVFFGRERKIAIANLARWAERGGRVVYGTDLGNAGPQPGIDEREVVAMDQAGMTPLDIIRAGTVTAATWLGLKRRGAIEPGYVADVIVVKGDALADPRRLTKIRHVFRDGIPAS